MRNKNFLSESDSDSESEEEFKMPQNPPANNYNSPIRNKKTLNEQYKDILKKKRNKFL